MRKRYTMAPSPTARRFGVALLLAASVALTVGGCIFGTDEDYLAGAPPPLQLVGAAPVDDASGIGRAAPLTLRFTHRVHPDGVGAEAVQLLADGAEVAAATKVDLLDCTLAVSPVTSFEADTDVTLEVDGIHGFGTGPLDAPVSQSYRTGAGLGTPAPRPTPSFAEVYSRVIAPRCASCHRAYRPPFGLDLSTPDVARDRLLHGVAKQDGAVPYVVSGQHGASYLMHKILGLPGVTGDPMPRTGGWPIDRHCQTPDPELRLIADWIDGLMP